MPSNELHRNQFALKGQIYWISLCDSAKMEVYLNPVKYCKSPTWHPKGHPCCKIADYDDTALGTGTLTVHPWRASPDCGKIIIICSVLWVSWCKNKSFWQRCTCKTNTNLQAQVHICKLLIITCNKSTVHNWFWIIRCWKPFSLNMFGFEIHS